MIRIATWSFIAIFFALSCQAQQQCASVSPLKVYVPFAGGVSSDITVTTTVPTADNNCGIYAPADFELSFVSCTNCNGTGLNQISVTQNSDGTWTFVYQASNTSPNLSCAPSTYTYVDGLGSETVYAIQNSPCQGISGPGRGPTGTTTNPQAPAAEPVSTGNGNYYYTHTDLSFGKSTLPLPMAFQRFYNSLDGRSGPLGRSWTNNYNITVNLISTPPVVVGVQWGDGHSETYVQNANGYVPSPGATNTLTGDPAAGNCTLTTKTGVQYIFSAGLLASIKDRNGNTITIDRDQHNNISNLILPNAELYFSYDSTTGRLTGISDGIRSVSYAYNAAGNLVSETDAAGGVTKYAYGSSSQLTSVTLPNNKLLVRNSYDSSGRVISQTNARGYITTFAYNAPAAGQTTITDPLGHNTIHTYDSSMRVTGIADPLGHSTNYAYDANNNVIVVTDGNGNASHTTYDSLGNVLSDTDPLGNVTSATYNQFSQPLSVTNANGKTTVFTYDANGNVTTFQDPLNNVSTFTYDTSGEVLTATDARTDTTTFTYSDFTLGKISDSLNNRTTLAYDTFNRLKSVTDPNGNAAVAVLYDPLNRITSLTDAFGNETLFAYDSVGNLTSVTDANQHVTKYSYDPVGNLTQVTDALGHVTKYAYDKNNNRTSFTNANGKATKYTYDAANRLIKVTEPLSLATSYGLDSVGNVTSLTDANGKKNAFTYDANNRLTKASYSDGKTVSFTYDADGNRGSMTDSHGTTAYTYDALDRVVTVAFPGTNSIQYAYDAVGNRTSLIYPDGSVFAFAYDADNRLSGVTDPLKRSTSYKYDPDSNVTGMTFPNGVTTALTYDPANRLTGITDSTNSVAYRVLAYALDNVGNRMTVTDGGVATNYTYDAVNELLSSQTSSGTTTWSYDSVGNRTQQVAPIGTTSYTYDADNRMLTAGATKFTYDKNGNRLTEVGTSGTTTYAYDANNRLLLVASPSGNNSFTYDGDGNRITQTTPSGTYEYVSDTAASLAVVLNEQGPDGTIDYAYGLGLLESSSSAFNYFYNLDGLGSVTNLTNATGAVLETYSYDAWGNALTSSGSVGTKNKFRFTGQSLDPNSGLYFLRARYYDHSSGRLLTKDPFNGFRVRPLTLNHYIYSFNNPVTISDPSGRLGGWDDIGFLTLGAVAGVTGQLSSDWLKGSWSSPWSYALQGATGALTSWAVGNCAELSGGFGAGACATLANGAGGALGSGLSDLGNGELPSPCKMLRSAGSSAIVGSASGVLPSGSENPLTAMVGGFLGSVLDEGSGAAGVCDGDNSPGSEGSPQSQAK